MLKLIIMSEWSYDKPVSGNEFYHIGWSEDLDKIKTTVVETVGNISL